MIITSSSPIAERPRELGDFKGVGHLEAKFYVEVLLFAPTSMDR